MDSLLTIKGDNPSAAYYDWNAKNCVYRANSLANARNLRPVIAKVKGSGTYLVVSQAAEVNKKWGVFGVVFFEDESGAGITNETKYTFYELANVEAAVSLPAETYDTVFTKVTGKTAGQLLFVAHRHADFEVPAVAANYTALGILESLEDGGDFIRMEARTKGGLPVDGKESVFVPYWSGNVFFDVSKSFSAAGKFELSDELSYLNGATIDDVEIHNFKGAVRGGKLEFLVEPDRTVTIATKEFPILKVNEQPNAFRPFFTAMIAEAQKPFLYGYDPQYGTTFAKSYADYQKIEASPAYEPFSQQYSLAVVVDERYEFADDLFVAAVEVDDVTDVADKDVEIARLKNVVAQKEAALRASVREKNTATQSLATEKATTRRLRTQVADLERRLRERPVPPGPVPPGPVPVPVPGPARSQRAYIEEVSGYQREIDRLLEKANAAGPGPEQERIMQAVRSQEENIRRARQRFLGKDEVVEDTLQYAKTKKRYTFSIMEAPATFTQPPPGAVVDVVDAPKLSLVVKFHERGNREPYAQVSLVSMRPFKVATEDGYKFLLFLYDFKIVRGQIRAIPPSPAQAFNVVSENLDATQRVPFAGLVVVKLGYNPSSQTSGQYEQFPESDWKEDQLVFRVPLGNKKSGTLIKIGANSYAGDMWTSFEQVEGGYGVRQVGILLKTV